TWYSVSPAHLDQLCRIPLIYVKDLSYVRAESDRQNIREHLQRGGFLCIDARSTPPRTPDMEAYSRTNRDILQRLIPGAEVRRLLELFAGILAMPRGESDSEPLRALLSRGGRIGWVRLVTARVDWQRHARADTNSPASSPRGFCARSH